MSIRSRKSLSLNFSSELREPLAVLKAVDWRGLVLFVGVNRQHQGFTPFEATSIVQLFVQPIYLLTPNNSNRLRILTLSDYGRRVRLWFSKVASKRCNWICAHESENPWFWGKMCSLRSTLIWYSDLFRITSDNSSFNIWRKQHVFESQNYSGFAGSTLYCTALSFFTSQSLRITPPPHLFHARFWVRFQCISNTTFRRWLLYFTREVIK